MSTAHIPYYLGDIRTLGVRLNGNGYEYGYWTQMRFNKLGTAKTYEEAMEKNGMTMTTAPDMRKAWQK